VASLSGFLSGVEAFLRANRLPPLPRHDVYKELRAGLTNIFGHIGKVIPAPTLDIYDIKRLRHSLDLRRYDDALFWCVFTIALQGLLRAGEFVAGRLRWGDIQEQPWGLQLTVPFSKTTPHSTDIALVKRGDWFCPVWATRHLLSFGHKHLTHSSPLYVKPYKYFNTDFQHRCKQAGITAAVTTHTLRRTGATMLFDAGVPEAAIMAHGRWVSLAWRRYIEFGSEQQRMPTEALLRAQRPI
jgi:integrase